MRVELKLNCKDFTGELREGDYEFDEGATVRELMDAAGREKGIILDENQMSSLVFMINGRPADWDSPLKEGDRLRVLFKILGG